MGRTSDWVGEVFEQAGAIERDVHVPLSAAYHGKGFVDRDLIMPAAEELFMMAYALARRFKGKHIDTVFGAAANGAIVASMAAVALQQLDSRPVFAVYAKEQDGVLALPQALRTFVDPMQVVLIVAEVIEDGWTVRILRDLILEGGATLEGVGTFWNRGGRTAADLDVPYIVTLYDEVLPIYPVDDCPLCRAGVPLRK